MSTKTDIAWTHDEIFQATNLFRFGYSNKQISKILKRTVNSVQSMFRREYAINGNSEPKKYTADQLLALPALLPGSKWQERAEANTAFLIELHRAGHTPGQGEYLMTSEARLMPRHIDVSRYSLCGSQAAMCASN